MAQHSPATEPRLIELRFALRRCIAKTALADIFWANDLHNTTPESPEKNALLLLVSPTFAQQDGFTKAWQHALSRPAPPSKVYPEILAYGEEKGQYWLALNNINGELLSERINELDERGLPLDSALYTLENISHALSSVQAGPFGHLEPGAIQQTGEGYVILNAPLVRVLQQLPDAGRATTNKLALHSAYISPSVAVGDTPVTEDDTFSAAALLYALLAGEPPFGEQSSLTAVTHDYRPAHLKKLNKKTWEELSSALAFQRKPRAENPDKLLTALRRTNKRKILLPAAALASLGLIGFGVYHLTSKVGDLIQTPTAQQQANAPAPVVIPAPVQNTAPAPVTAPVARTAEANPETTAPNTQPTETRPETPVAEANPESEADRQTEQQAAASPEPETVRQTEQQNTETTETEPETTVIELVDEPQIAEPVTEQTAANNTDDAATEPETTAENAAATAEVQKTQQLAALLEQAEVAAKDNNTTPEALALLRQINELDEDNAQTKTLLNQMLENTLNRAETDIENNDFDQAQTRLADSDKIIREFMVSGQLQRLVRLESKLAVSRQEQTQVDELLTKARSALQAGNLSKDDAEDDYALLHLNNLMFKQPDNPQGLELLQDVAQRRQQAARLALEEGELEQAGTYLSESQRLIRRYRLTALESGQQTLDAAYANATLQIAPVADIQSSPEVTEIEVLDPVTTLEAEQLPTETPAVNPISIQEIPLPGTEPTITNNQNGIDTAAPEPVVNVSPETIPQINAAPAVPIWESDTLGQARNQPVQNNTVVRPAQQPQQIPTPQPVVTYQPPVPAPANTVNQQPRQPVQQTDGVYTYQPDSQLVEPVNPQVINQFTATARPVGAAPALNLPEVSPGFQPQPQVRVQQPQQRPQDIRQPQIRPQPQALQPPQQLPQGVSNIPEMVPVEMIPELEEIPLSDIEEILPATN